MLTAEINQNIGVWFFISGSYLMVLFAGFMIGFFVRWWKSKKQVIHDTLIKVAKKNPHYMSLLEEFRKRTDKRNRK